MANNASDEQTVYIGQPRHEDLKVVSPVLSPQLRVGTKIWYLVYPEVPPEMLPITKDPGNERIRTRQNFPENLSS